MNKKVYLMQFEIEVIHTMKDINIVDEFLNSYYRSPTKKEFILLGGDIKTVEKKFKSYRKFLDYYGYDAPTRTKTLQVLDDRNNIVYEGTTRDIAEKYGVYYTTVLKAVNHGLRLKCCYSVRNKELKL
ncbi:MAG: hypothetical protein ACLTE9_14345 [Thomasclavelia ramosa]